jgi:hypothetical protein
MLIDRAPRFDFENAPDTDPPRHQHWTAQASSVGWHQAAEDTSRSWTEDEIDSFRKRWPLGTKERTAFELFLNCGQRRADTVRMA